MAATLEPASHSGDDLERVFREHHAMVFRAAYRITGNADDAEDALQTVFLRMIKRDPAAQPGGNVASFPGHVVLKVVRDPGRARRGEWVA